MHLVYVPWVDPRCAAHAGSDDSSTFALEMLGALPAGFPLLSHADLGLQPLSDFLPSGLHITPLSSGLTAEAPNGFQVAPGQRPCQIKDYLKT